MHSGNVSLAAILRPSGASSRLTIIQSRSLALPLPVSSGSKWVAPTTLPSPFARKRFYGARHMARRRHGLVAERHGTVKTALDARKSKRAVGGDFTGDLSSHTSIK